ncbi:hypothetical protein WISP_105428 [Willisornis vidua]|uniref:Uncharacterized protein n=1 Tax=Willisornis vidua TaxID=1566151 RepID=A0ABQ9D030_9PASS|nr:hypothetical protein WISP_105428 [Willisornis vidua]
MTWFRSRNGTSAAETTRAVAGALGGPEAAPALRVAQQDTMGDQQSLQWAPTMAWARLELSSGGDRPVEEKVCPQDGQVLLGVAGVGGHCRLRLRLYFRNKQKLL